MYVPREGIGPALCAATGGPRTSGLPPVLRPYVAAARARGRVRAGPVIFRCRHRAYGVGTFNAAEVRAADRSVAEVGTDAAAEVLVGGVSHCLGVQRALAAGAPPSTSTTS